MATSPLIPDGELNHLQRVLQLCRLRHDHMGRPLHSSAGAGLYHVCHLSSKLVEAFASMTSETRLGRGGANLLGIGT